MTLYRPLTFVQHILDKQLHPQSIVIDATLGNGNDTLYIAKSLDYRGKIFGFDVQQAAIENTKTKLSECSEDIKCQITLHLESHANMLSTLDAYINKVDCILFNLGFLPHYDETITTLLESTYKAILQANSLLKQKGLLIVVAYPGHENGKIEFTALQQLFQKASRNFYYITNYQQINTTGNPPSVFVIEKRK